MRGDGNRALFGFCTVRGDGRREPFRFCQVRGDGRREPFRFCKVRGDECREPFSFDQVPFFERFRPINRGQARTSARVGSRVLDGSWDSFSGFADPR